MTAAEFKFCVAVAKDRSVDLSGVDDSALYGFGLPDFVPVHVSIKAVAKCLRWQCCTFAGGWDERQFNEDRPSYLKRIELSDFTPAEAAGLVADVCGRVMAGGVK